MSRAFIQAIKAGDAVRVRDMLKLRPPLLYSVDVDGTSALLIALYWGKSEVLQALQSSRPKLTIFEAAALGDTARIQMLLRDRPARVRSFSHDGYTALHLAAFFGRVAAVRALLRGGASVNVESRNGMCVQPLGSAAAGNHTQVCRLLLDAGADVHARQAGGFTALMSAEQNGNAELAELLRRA
jgi:ankyrin repeat protein